MNILHLDASVLGTQSASRELSANITTTLRQQFPTAQVSYRDLDADALPHWRPIDGASREPGDLGERILEEFLAADIVVIGAPMYNFGIPTQLKAWIDHIAVPGKVFQYTANGPEGLAGGKRVIVASTRGGVYSQGPAAAMDHQESYLKAFFGFIGINDVEFVRAEGIAMGPEHRTKALDRAHAEIRGLVQRAA